MVAEDAVHQRVGLGHVRLGRQNLNVVAESPQALDRLLALEFVPPAVVGWVQVGHREDAHGSIIQYSVGSALPAPSPAKTVRPLRPRSHVRL